MKKEIIETSALFSSGLTAGTFFYGTFCVLPTFYKVTYHIEMSFRTVLMNYNKYTVMTLVIFAMLTSIAHFWQVRENKRARIWSIAGIFLVVLILLITRLGSVPINIEMKSWNTLIPPTNYDHEMHTWDLYNMIRTVASLINFICLLISSKRPTIQ